MGDGDSLEDKMRKQGEQKKPGPEGAKPESEGTPIDMTPDPSFRPMHRGEQLSRGDMLEMLESLGRKDGDKDDEEDPPPLDKTTSSGK